MTDELALLRAVLESPQDNLPRLVLADYWDEYGNPERAELVRVQIELAKYHAGEYEPTGDTIREVDAKWVRHNSRKLALELQTHDLLIANPQWASSIAEAIYGPQAKPYVDYGSEGDKNGISWTWDRGFISELRLPLAEFIDVFACIQCRGQGCSDCEDTGDDNVAERVFRCEPVTNVVATDRRPTQRETLGPQFGWMRGLGTVGLGNAANAIPERLFNELSGDVWAVYWRVYPSRKLALDDLSRVLVEHGRKLAGLNQSLSRSA